MTARTRLKLTLAFEGTRFWGWQLQPGKRTVQGVVEDAVARLALEPVRVHGASRTDSGVHALGMVAHLDIPETRRHLPWHRALNALLPEDVAVVEAAFAPPGFHARFSAVSKVYSYTLWTRPEFLFPQRRNFVWACGPLDFAAMDQAMALFVGRHDFKGFQNTGTPILSTLRSVLSFTREPGIFPEETVLRIRADGFLKQMVRNIVGCLVAIGRGKVPPERVRSLLNEGDRTKAPATAPGRGLCLEAVFYGEAEHGRNRMGSRAQGQLLGADDADLGD